MRMFKFKRLKKFLFNNLYNFYLIDVVGYVLLQKKMNPCHSGFGPVVAVGQQNGSTRFAFNAGLMKSKQAVQQQKCLAHSAMQNMSLYFHL